MTTSAAASSSQVPASRKASQLQRLVLSYVHAVQSDDELNSLAREGLNSALSMMNTRRWNKLVAYQDITLVTDQSDYALNLDFKDPFHVELLDVSGNPDGRLHYKELKRMLREHPRATQSGSPRIYSIIYNTDRVLSLEVAPTIGFVGAHPTLRNRYYRRVPLLTGNGSRTGLPSEFDWFLIWHARAEVASALDPQLVNHAEGKTDQLWRALKIDDNASGSDWTEGS